MNSAPYVAGKAYVNNKCDGCQSCVTLTCPYGAISFDTTTNTATIDQSKCIGWQECANLNGGQTACEINCPDPNSLAFPTASLAIVRG